MGSHPSDKVPQLKNLIARLDKTYYFAIYLDRKRWIYFSNKVYWLLVPRKQQETDNFSRFYSFYSAFLLLISTTTIWTKIYTFANSLGKKITYFSVTKCFRESFLENYKKLIICVDFTHFIQHFSFSFSTTTTWITFCSVWQKSTRLLILWEKKDHLFLFNKMFRWISPTKLQKTDNLCRFYAFYSAFLLFNFNHNNLNNILLDWTKTYTFAYSLLRKRSLVSL